jgi:hypothetical protein
MRTRLARVLRKNTHQSAQHQLQTLQPAHGSEREGCIHTPNMNLTVASSGVSNDDFAFSHAAMSACLSASLAIVEGAVASLSSCSVKPEVAIEISEFAWAARRRRVRSKEFDAGRLGEGRTISVPSIRSAHMRLRVQMSDGAVPQ